MFPYFVKKHEIVYNSLLSFSLLLPLLVIKTINFPIKYFKHIALQYLYCFWCWRFFFFDKQLIEIWLPIKSILDDPQAVAYFNI